MEMQTIYVNRDDSRAVVECPHCGSAKTRYVGKFKGNKRRVRVRCSCHSAFPVKLEFRKAYRKETHLQGHYIRLPGVQERGKMWVRNLSLTGMGLFARIGHNINQGDKLKVKFTLDDRNHSEIEKNAVVRWVEDRNVGCEFMQSVEYNETDDAALNFYLMP